MTEVAAPPPSQLERVLWRVVLVLLLIGCTLMVWAALGGRLGPTQGRILLSSFGVALYVSLALACTRALARQPTSLGARAGVAFATVGALLFVLGVWTQLPHAVLWWRVLGVTFFMSCACAHASGLLCLQLANRFEPLRHATRAASYGCALVLSTMCVLGLGHDLWWRIASVLFTLALFGSAAMPVLVRLSRDDDAR